MLDFYGSGLSRPDRIYVELKPYRVRAVQLVSTDMQFKVKFNVISLVEVNMENAT